MNFFFFICKVYLHFNIVGHTHDLVDQMFSIFAHMLKRTQSRDPSEFLDKFKNGYPGLFTPEYFDEVYDFSETLGEFNEPMVGVKAPHHFLIELVDNKIRLR